MKRVEALRHGSKLRLFFWAVLMVMISSVVHAAEDDICAQVKIEIRQELTLERQAFDAHMRITNGLSHVTLDQVGVTVWFTDKNGNAVRATSDPSDTSALFFIRVDEMTNITDVGGAGSVAPSTVADIHWLIIPALGAANGLASGELYYVGATLSYTVGGEANTTEVTPDYIYVKPMPDLVLDYFLPEDVYGDDAFTFEVEPPVPFSLGVRVKNTGYGTARNLAIKSAQPRIVENEQGLLIGFSIIGSQVNGMAATDSLLADFGDIAPQTAGMARWQMICTLSGKFISFDADISHSDELGGEVTSLIHGVETHTLVADVLVDLPGRDSILDFLAKDGEVYRIYESDSTDTVVTDQSSASTLTSVGVQGGRNVYTLTTTINPGFGYLRVPDPHNGTKSIISVVRGDGKVIRSSNAWLSKTRNGRSWNHFINLFDVGGGGQYTVTLGDVATGNRAPVLQYIPDVTGLEGTPIGFIVQASDPDGTIPALSTSALPPGARFTDQENGFGSFSWTPAPGQAGTYPITFTASDGSLFTRQQATLVIRSLRDTDGDGLDDDWEMEHFGTLDRDGTGDFDGDGISDLEEFLMGSDPTAEDHAPTIPVILSPVEGQQTDGIVQLVIENSTDADGDALFYEFEVYTDDHLTDLVARDVVEETPDTTSWTIPAPLSENAAYVWRVRATDGYSFSLWAYGSFTRGVPEPVVIPPTEDGAPFAPELRNPGQRAWTTVLRPELQVAKSRVPDGDVTVYRYEVYEDAELTRLLAWQEAEGLSWTVGITLPDRAWYYWRARAIDARGLESPWSETGMFFVKEEEELLPDTITVKVTTDTGKPLSGLKVYAYTAAGTYTGKATTTDEKGIIHFDPGLFPAGTYLFRVDCLGGQFWSAATALPETRSIPIVIDTESVTVTVKTAADTISGVKVYLFSESGSYLGIVLTTDAGGQVTIDLPVGQTYKFGVDVLGSQYWSDLINVSAESTTAVVNVDSSSRLQVTVRQDAATPMAGVRVYLCNEKKSYLGVNGTTDESGMVVFAVTKGTYTLGADYMGSQFWTETITVSTDTAEILEIPHQPVRVAVTGEYQGAPVPLKDVRVALFSEKKSYLSQNLTTDADGYAVFSVPEIPLMIRADLLGRQYWSETVTWEDPAIVIPLGDARINVSGAGLPIQGAKVYSFTGDRSYRGLSGVTDASGQVMFRLPEGEYDYRVDCQSRQFWADDQPLVRDGVTDVGISVGGGTFSLSVKTDAGAPLSGVRCRVFDGDTYMGLAGLTDDTGTVSFALTDGTRRFRVDYLGKAFWTDPIRVSGSGSHTLTIPHTPVTVSVTSAGSRVPGANVYFFTPSGTYLGQVFTTDTNGEIALALPVGVELRFRADILGSPFWSESVTLATNMAPVVIDAGGGRLGVTVRTSTRGPLEGIRTYLGNMNGQYLGLSGTTDASGRVYFDVPEGVYQVRADYLGYSFWHEDIAVTADTDTALVISTRPVTVIVSGVLAGTHTPLAAVRTYLFNATGTYQGITAKTDDQGRVTLDLPDLPYQVGVEYMGGQFGSGLFTGTEAVVPIPMANAAVKVTSAGLPVSGAHVRLYSPAGTYLGKAQVTDETGAATFRVPEGDYRFRADYQAGSGWSGDVSLSPNTDHPVLISMGGGNVALTVEQNDGTPLSGVRTDVLSGTGTQLGLSGSTNENGQVFFDLEDGTFRFRADYLGYPCTTDPVTVPDTLSRTLRISHQDTTVTFVAMDGETPVPLSGRRIHLFTPSGTYMGQYRDTDDHGRAVFRLPDQAYQFRCTELGQHYWSDTVQGADATVRVVRGKVGITVTTAGDAAKNGRVYLFSENQAYLGQYVNTDQGGHATFALPEGRYRFRADINGRQQWTDVVIVPAGEEVAVDVEM